MVPDPEVLEYDKANASIIKTYIKLKLAKNAE